MKNHLRPFLIVLVLGFALGPSNAIYASALGRWIDRNTKESRH